MADNKRVKSSGFRRAACLRQGALELELLEGARDDVFDVLAAALGAAQDVEQRVVAQPEPRKQWRRLPLHYCPARMTTSLFQSFAFPTQKPEPFAHNFEMYILCRSHHMHMLKGASLV